MARDFRAKQLRTSVIIGSGSIESNRPHLGLVFYSASKASDFDGTRRTGGSTLSSATQLNLSKDAIALPHRFGDDVWCLFDGQSVSQNAAMTTERTVGSTVLFIGDVVISGSLFAERQMIEVDTTTVGNFRTPVGSSAFFDGGFAGSGVDITAGGEVKAFTSVRSPIFLNDGANVTLKTTTSGDVDIHPVSGISKFKFDANSFSTLTVSDGSHTTLATSETGNLTIDSAGTVVLDAASTAAAGMSLNSAGGVAIDAAAGPISIDTTHNNAAAINITSNGGTSEKILIKNTQGNAEAAAADGAIKVEATAGGITLDAALDVHISADGGNISFSDGTTTVMDFDVDNVKFKMMDDADTGDYFEIATAANGHTTLATIDDDATSAHLVLDIDGDVYLDPAGGNFVWDLAGTRQGHWAFSSGGAAHVFWVDGNGQSLLSFQNTINNGTVSSLRMATSRKIEFHDDSQYIHAPSDNNLTAKANDSITLDAGDRATGDHAGTGTTTDSGAVLLRNTGIHIGGAGTGVGVASIADTQSPIRIFKATQTVYPASQNSNSSHVNWPFDGTSGTAVAQAGDLVISNRTALNGVNANGKIILDGSVTIGDQNVNNLTVTGNLEVQGTTTTISTTNLNVEDAIIVLQAELGSGVANPTDLGIIMERGSTGDNAAIIWDEGADKFLLGTTAETGADTDVTVAVGTVQVGKLEIDGTTNHIDVSTDVIVTAAADITFTAGAGNVTPTVDNAAALGSSAKRWSDLFLASGGILNFNGGDTTLTHVNTEGVLLNGTKQFQFGDSGTYINQSANSKLAVVADGEIHLSAPLVGVGTTAPNEPLHVREAKASTGVSNTVLKLHSFINDGFADGDGPGIKFSAGDAAAADNTIGRIFCERDGADNEGRLGFMAGTNGAEEFMTIKSSGNVGVGVVDPDTKLEVLSTSSQLKLSYDATNFVTLTTGGNGNTTIATTDSDGTLGHIALHANGAVDLRSDSGQFRYKDSAGNEMGRFEIDSNNLDWKAFDGTSTETLFSLVGTKYNSAGDASFRMASGKKLEFADAGESIHGDGNDLIITSGRHVSLAGASSQLNFSDSNSRIYRDGGVLMFRDTSQTTAVSLSSLNSTAAAGVVVEDASGPDRARVVPEAGGGFSVSSLNKYVNEGGLQGTPVSSDLFFYVGDDGSSRTNAAFKNDVAVSGSMRLVDNSDGLSQSKLLQNADNLIFRMNRNTAAATEASHDIVTIESAAGIKLGTTVGSGNAGLYFQGASLNLQKITATVEASSQACIQIQGHLLPQADNTFNLGTADRRFANLYTGDLHLNNMGSSNDVDGTSGNWTIQEGEDNLYVINNITGKKFKMMLQPVGAGE